MGFKVYRERRLPEETISFSVAVSWPDGTLSHEEVTIPEGQCGNEQEITKVIRDTLKDWKKARPNRRVPGNVKAERQKEFGKIAGTEDSW